MPYPRHRDSFLGYVHSLRGLAILWVVIGHTAEAEGWSWHSPFRERFVYALVGNATVPFIFVSGFLFQHLSARFRYRPYITKRLKTVVLPYVVVSLPALFEQYAMGTGVFRQTGQRSPIITAVSALLSGAHMPIPLWYVPVIVLFFLAAPGFVLLDRRPSLYWLILPTLLLASVLHRPLYFRLVWQSALYFLPVYLTGMWASHYREVLLERLERRRWWLAGLLIACFSTEVVLFHQWGPIYSLQPFSTELAVFDLDLATKLLLTLWLLEALRRYDARVRPWFSTMADVSFGIFFLHEYVIKVGQIVLRRLHLALAQPGLGILVLTVPLVMAITLLGIRLIQRVLGERSRMVIGC